MNRIRKENLAFTGENSEVNSDLDNNLLFENYIAPEYITTSVAAQFLGVSENALRIKVCRGQIPAHKLGRGLRFKLSEIKGLFSPKE